MPKASTSTLAYACHECGRLFKRNCDLNRHSLIHSLDANELKVKCPYEGCSYSTLQKSNVKTHITAVHLKMKPNRCSIDGCTSAFGDAASLIRHEKTIHKHYRKLAKAGRKTKKDAAVIKKEEQFIDLPDAFLACPTPALSTTSSSSSSPSPSLHLPTPSPSPPVTPYPSASMGSLQARMDALEEAKQIIQAALDVPYPSRTISTQSSQSYGANFAAYPGSVPMPCASPFSEPLSGLSTATFPSQAIGQRFYEASIFSSQDLVDSMWPHASDLYIPFAPSSTPLDEIVLSGSTSVNGTF